MAWNLLKMLRDEYPLEVRRRWFVRLARGTFFVIGILGAAQTYWAVRTGAVWRDYLCSVRD